MYSFMLIRKKEKSRKIRISYFLIYHIIIFGNLFNPNRIEKNKNNIPFFNRKKLKKNMQKSYIRIFSCYFFGKKKKNTSFSFIVTHVYEASVHSSVPWIIGNTG